MTEERTDIPEVGKIYKHFDDGKIRMSRMSTVKIIGVIPFNEIDVNILKIWEKQFLQSYWLYSSKTDFFIKGIVDEVEVIYVRTKDLRWFSLGLFAGELDLDGSLYLMIRRI